MTFEVNFFHSKYCPQDSSKVLHKSIVCPLLLPSHSSWCGCTSFLNYPPIERHSFQFLAITDRAVINSHSEKRLNYFMPLFIL